MAGVSDRPAAVRLTTAAALLAVLIFLGGGGSPTPDIEALVELIALAAAGVAIAVGLRPLDILRADPVWATLLIAIVAFPLVQLVPLPPAVWHALPGRETTAAALDAIGQAAAWRPWSLLPDGGVTAALALAPALVLALTVADRPPRQRVVMIGALAALGFAAALLGLVQFIRGAERPLSFYADVHRGWGIGFFANRNAQADLIAIAMTAAVLLVDRCRDLLGSGTARVGVAAALLLMLAGGIVAGSRMGMVSLAVPLLLAVALAGRRAPWLAGGVAAAGALLLVGGTALDRVTARAHDTGNRAEIWGDSLFVARQVAPVGGGMGSFQPLYTAAEELDHVQPTAANRAHNEYLELAIEGGVPALALLVAALAFVARRAAAGWRLPDLDRRVLARFGGLTALILAVHSTVDYPLRTLTLIGVAGLALGGLASPRMPPHNAEKGGAA